MHTDKLQQLFAEYLTKEGLGDMMVCDGCVTVGQDSMLKYERADKYRVLFLDQREIKNLMRFCENHGMAVWFGADKLCIGFNYKGCMRLSEYASVQHRLAAGEGPEDIIDYVPPEISAEATLGDRIEVRA